MRKQVGSSSTSADGIATWTDPGSGKVYVYLSGVTNASASASGSGVTAFPIHNALPANGSYAGGGVYGGGNSDAFVAKFDLTMTGGDALLYSTYLGGSGDEDAAFVAVDGQGNAYVCGDTNSVNFPTTQNCDQANNHGGFDAFVAKIVTSSAGQTSLAYSTYLGGSQDDHAYRIALDSAGNVYLTGYTDSSDFPTSAQAFQPHLKGWANAFVTCLNASGSALVYSTYLGGSLLDLGLGIAVDGSDNAFVTGATVSWDFPTVNPLQSQNYLNGTATGSLSADAFVTEVNPSGTSLLSSTYLGGSGTDEGVSVKVDAYDNAYVVGYTSSPDFPVTNTALLPFGGGGSDVFVTKLSPQNISNGSPVSLQSVTLTPSIVQGGGTVSGTVTLTGSAPSNGATVQLVSSQPGLAQPVPTSVSIAPNATSGTFVLPTRAVSSATQVLITGTYGCPQTAQLLVTPGSPTSSPQLLSVTLNPATVTGGNSTTGTVTLTSAPATGTTVNVLVSATSLTNVASVSTSTVAITSPAVSGPFTVNTQPVTTETSALISASLNGIQQNAVLTVEPSPTMTLTLNPTTVANGASSQGKITLSQNAASPLAIYLTTSDATNTSFPGGSSVPIAAGASTATFTINTQTVTAVDTVTITAQSSGVSNSPQAQLVLVPCGIPSVLSVSLNPMQVYGGTGSGTTSTTNSTGTVTLSGPALEGGQVIALSSSNGAATVPANVTVSAGATSATFTITTSPVTVNTTAVIYAAYAGNPPQNASLEVMPLNPSIGLGLTPAGISEGFKLTTFVYGFTDPGDAGPLGMAFYGQKVFVTDLYYGLRIFADVDNQLLPSNSEGNGIEKKGLTVLNDCIYAAFDNEIAQIDLAGNIIAGTVMTGFTAATGILANPFTGHLYVDEGESGAMIWEVDPIAMTMQIIFNKTSSSGPDGLVLSPDGHTLYVATDDENDIIGIDTTTYNIVFDYNMLNPGVPIIDPDGIAVGTGILAGQLFVNTNNSSDSPGYIYQIDIATGVSFPIAGGGTRGDFMAPDPNGTLLVTQSDRVLRLIPPPGAGFNGAPSNIIATRDDLTNPNTTPYATFSPTLNTTTNALVGTDTPSASFDLTGLDSAELVQAAMQRGGQLVSNNSAYFDMQFGLASASGQSLSPPSNDMPGQTATPNPLPYTAYWALSNSIFGDIQTQFGSEYQPTLVDVVSTVCGGYTIFDTPEMNWPSWGSKNILTTMEAPGGNSKIAPGRALDVSLAWNDVAVNNSWEILLNQSVIASSGDPESWSVETDPINPQAVWVTVPATASIGMGYEVRLNNGIGSGFFDVAASGQSNCGAPVLLPIALIQNPVVGGNSINGTISLDAPAPPGGADVTLTTVQSATGLGIPQHILIAPTMTSAPFTITSASVNANEQVGIYASFNGTRSFVVTVLSAQGSVPGAPINLTATGLLGAIGLNWTAATGAVTYNVKRLMSDGLYHIIATGITNTTWTDHAVASGVTYYYKVSASNIYGEGPDSNIASAMPTGAVPVMSLTLTPSSVVGGNLVVGTVTLSSVVTNTNGQVVGLTSSGLTVSMPASIMIPYNSSSANFIITTVPVSEDTTGTITASIGSSSASANLTVQAPTILALTLTPNPVTPPDGSTAVVTGTVILNGPAASNGKIIDITSSNTDVAYSVEDYVSVPGGQTTQVFPLIANSVVSSTQVIITAIDPDMDHYVNNQPNSVSQALTVNPANITCYLANLTLNKSCIIGNDTVTVTVTLSAGAPTGGAIVTLQSNQPGLIGPIPSIMIAQGNQTGSIDVPIPGMSISGVTDVTYITISGNYNTWTQGARLTALPAGYNLSVPTINAGAGNGCVVLTWQALPNGSVQGYNIYRRSPGGTAVKLNNGPQTANMYGDTGISQTYEYEISVVDTTGAETSFSSWTSSTTPNTSGTTLTWASLPDNSTPYSGVIKPDAILSDDIPLSIDLIVDGKIMGTVIDDSDIAPQLTGYYYALLDTRYLTNGLPHTVQFVGYTTTTFFATIPMTIQTSNSVSNMSIDVFSFNAPGNVYLVDATLPANTQTWSSSLVDSSNSNDLRQWNGVGSAGHFAVDSAEWLELRTGPPTVTAPIELNPPVSVVPAPPSDPQPQPRPWQPDPIVPAPPTLQQPEPNFVSVLALVEYISIESTNPQRKEAGLPPITNLPAVGSAGDPDFSYANHIDFDLLQLAAELGFQDTTLFYSLLRSDPVSSPNIALDPLLNKWIRDQLASGATQSFYLYGHGNTWYDASGNIKQGPVAVWGGCWFYSSTPPGLTQPVLSAWSVNPKYIILPNVVGSNIYDFAWIDACSSAGGTADNLGNPNLNNICWYFADAFNITSDPDLIATFVGWSGSIGSNLLLNGANNPLLSWREDFWDRLTEYGELVDAALFQANNLNWNVAISVNSKYVQYGYGWFISDQ